MHCSTWNKHAWLSGRASASHAEGPWFESKCVHIMKIIGHRGCRWRSGGTSACLSSRQATPTPGNRLINFKKALKYGVDAVEFDVQKGLIICHDQPQKGRKYLKLGKLLDFLQDKDIEINIEIKVPYLLPAVLAEVKKRHLEKRVVICSFLAEEVKLAKKLCPSLKTAMTVEGLSNVDLLTRLLKWTKADFLDLEVNYLNKKLIREMNKEGVKVRTWVINDLKLAKKLKKWGLWAIFTDDPHLYYNTKL